MAHWTSFGTTFGPWITNKADLSQIDSKLDALPTWNIQIPRGARAARAALLALGSGGAVIETLELWGINAGMTPTTPTGSPDKNVILAQMICQMDAPVIGGESFSDGGFGNAGVVKMVSAHGTFLVGDYYKALDKALRTASYPAYAASAAADISSCQEIEGDTTSEILVGNLAFFTHLGLCLNGTPAGLGASGTVTGVNMAVSFLID